VTWYGVVSTNTSSIFVNDCISNILDVCVV